jgi:hypothetical protein
MVFFEKQKLKKNIIKAMLPLIKENKSDLLRRKSQFSDDEKAKHLWTILNIANNWCYKLCEYYNQYKSNVKKIDMMVESINKLRKEKVDVQQQEYEDGKDVDEILKTLEGNSLIEGGDHINGGESSLLIDLQENILRDESKFNQVDHSAVVHYKTIPKEEHRKSNGENAIVDYIKSQEEKPLISPL